MEIQGIIIFFVIGLLFIWWHLNKIKSESGLPRHKRDKRLAIIAKYITIFTFPIIAYTFYINYQQAKLVKNEINASTVVSISQLTALATDWQNNGGDRASYTTAKFLAKDISDEQLKKIIGLQINKIKKIYSSWIVDAVVNRYPVLCKSADPKKPCSNGLMTKDDFSIGNTLAHLSPEKIWQERAKAAYFLGFAEKAENYKKEICKKLITHIKEENEPSLLVAVLALKAYKQLTDFDNENILAFEEAIAHYKQEN